MCLRCSWVGVRVTCCVEKKRPGKWSYDFYLDPSGVLSHGDKRESRRNHAVNASSIYVQEMQSISHTVKRCCSLFLYLPVIRLCPPKMTESLYFLKELIGTSNICDILLLVNGLFGKLLRSVKTMFLVGYWHCKTLTKQLPKTIRQINYSWSH